MAVVGLAVWLSGLTRLFGLHPEPGAFYQVVPSWAMVAPGLVMLCWWLGVWVAGGVRFWRETARDGHAAPVPRASGHACHGVGARVHLGVVAALFATAPYGKFVHAVYRFLALVRYRLERGAEG